MDGTTVVISPLIALMQDQVRALRENGINAQMINSSQSYQDICDIKEQLLRSEVKLLYIAPERLGSNEFLNLLHSININFFVVDEAHCVSEWGHEFRSDYRTLSQLKELFPNVSIAAFTATATKKVQEDISMSLGLREPLELRGKTYRKNLKIDTQLRVSNGKKQLSNFLNKHKNECGIVYAFSRKDVENMASYLQSEGFKAKAYHAGLSSDVRDEVYREFTYDRIDIVVATIAFGMGIDKSNIRFVVHMSMPKTMENFYQEIGRAGRDGLDSETLLLYTKADEIQRRMLIEDIENIEYKNLMYTKLNKMYSFANSSECKHQKIAQYFDDHIEPCEKLCSACLRGEVKQVDISVPSQKLLSAIYRCDQRFGINHVVDVLRGSKSKRVLQFKHDRLSVYGIGEDVSKSSWSAIADRLFELDAITIGEFKSVKITKHGLDILKAKVDVSIDEEKLKMIKKESSKNQNKDTQNTKEFDALRGLRKEISDQNNVPAYIVFSDKTLYLLAVELPQTKDEMLMINGVGEVKYERYGEEFLELCRSLKSG
jgi:ATP-dependent DNA helicase RecQ